MTERSFRQAYGVLQQHAQTLRTQAEPNIDDLLTIVKESVEAYTVCKERIDAVEAALKVALDGADVGASAPQSAATTGQPADVSIANIGAATHTTRTGPPLVAPEAEGDSDDVPF